MLKGTDELPGWTNERAPDEIVKKTRTETHFFQPIGSACCECWQAFAGGETVRVYTFPSGTRLWFHHGTCWRDWWHAHKEIIGLAIQLEAGSQPENAASDTAVQAAFSSALLDS